MKNLLIVIFLITSINKAFPQDSVKLNKGQEAPFEGFLINKERTTELIKAEKQNITLRELGKQKDELTDFYKQDARNARNETQKEKTKSFWKSTGYFILGVLITGFAFKVTEKVNDL